MNSLLVLARHAESERNAAKRGWPFFGSETDAAPFRGQADRSTVLTEAGRALARAPGERLREEHESFDVIVDSGFRRTQETVEHLLEAWPVEERDAIERHSNDLLRERDAGYALNMTEEEAASAFPWLQEYWRTEGPYFERPPGGESLADLALRVKLFLESDLKAFAGRRLLLVTHIGTMQMLRMHLEAWPLAEIDAKLRGEPIRNCDTFAYTLDSTAAYTTTPTR